MLTENHKAQEQPETLRNYLMKYTKMKTVKSNPYIEKGYNLNDIELKPEELFEARTKDLIRFIEQKIEKKDNKLFTQLKKRVLEISELFQKSLTRWRGSFDEKKYKHIFQKPFSTKSETPFSNSQLSEGKVSSSQLLIQKSEKKLSEKKPMNWNMPSSTLIQSNRRIKTDYGHRLESNEKKTSKSNYLDSDRIRQNKSAQWIRSSKVIEEKEGDQDISIDYKEQLGFQRLRKDIKQKTKNKEIIEKLSNKPPEIQKTFAFF